MNLGSKNLSIGTFPELNASMEESPLREKFKSNSTTKREDLFTTELPINLTTIVNQSINNVTTITPNSTTITNDATERTLHPVHYLIITCGVILILLLLAYVIYRLYRKEQFRRLRLQLLPVYNFDPTESDDWQHNLLVTQEFTSLRTREKDKANYNSISTAL